MKLFALLGLLFYASACSCSTPPEWKITVRVVDETGNPIPGADAKVGYHAKPQNGQSVAMDAKTGKTDTNGLFRATGRSEYMLYCSATKPGYYLSGARHELGVTRDKPRHEPWNPTQTLVLREIRNPIPMYAKATRSNVPEAAKSFGYDLMAGDWVAPAGKGKETDIIFTAHLDQRAENDFDYKLIVSFPKEGDGIQSFTVSDQLRTSTLRSPHEAPEGDYLSQWVKEQNRRPGQPAVYGLDENLNFFIRVRTVLDEQGRVKSALYGKIYGAFMNFRYYLNPQPNSRNIEFDPKRNLLKGLKSFEDVDLP